MGRNEHRKSKNSFMGQTPAHQKLDGIDVEFAQEAADHADLEAQERARQADKRAKQK
ncbi:MULTISPECIES: YfhD family protein [Clostridia]|uniref:YfhD family protein n=1 Tax=Clostridia TaxID=186801 RepID=UPI000EA33B24|nr:MULTISPECIES: YfhD family protein [Clostridia]NBJ68029.1 YfhD family protein [Roseburia sp. 1XD42-34]RKI82470.1 YfhD family protein [Clostridium sp. 1xD42-85]